MLLSLVVHYAKQTDSQYMNERGSKKVFINPFGPKSKVTEGSLYTITSFSLNIWSSKIDIL